MTIEEQIKQISDLFEESDSPKIQAQLAAKFAQLSADLQELDDEAEISITCFEVMPQPIRRLALAGLVFIYFATVEQSKRS